MKILILIIVVVFIVSMKSIKKALINFELSRFIGKNENEIKKTWGNPMNDSFINSDVRVLTWHYKSYLCEIYVKNHIVVDIVVKK